MTKAQRHKRLGVEIEALIGQLEVCDQRRIEADKKYEELHHKLREKRSARRSCIAICHYCRARAFMTGKGKLPEGWSLKEISHHANEWSELDFEVIQICPRGHEDENQ